MSHNFLCAARTSNFYWNLAREKISLATPGSKLWTPLNPWFKAFKSKQRLILKIKKSHGGKGSENAQKVSRIIWMAPNLRE